MQKTPRLGQSCHTCQTLGVGPTPDVQKTPRLGQSCHTCQTLGVGPTPDVQKTPRLGQSCHTCQTLGVGPTPDVHPAAGSGRSCQLCQTLGVGPTPDVHPAAGSGRSCQLCQLCSLCGNRARNPKIGIAGVPEIRATAQTTVDIFSYSQNPDEPHGWKPPGTRCLTGRNPDIRCQARICGLVIRFKEGHVGN